jgi:cell division septation protein DedD
VPTYVLHRFPYFIAMSLAYGLINYPTPYMKAFQMWTGLFPAFIRATGIALLSRKKKPTYRVNVKPGEKKRKKSPWIAVLPQQGIIILAIFSMVYGFVEWDKPSWDFYILNCIWAVWSIWTMSGICIAAVKKHKWPKKGALEEKKVPSFFSRTKELFLTVAFSICVLLFFTTADMTDINQYLTNFRLEVLRAAGIEKPLVQIDKPMVLPAQNPAPIMNNTAGNQDNTAIQQPPLQEKKEETTQTPSPVMNKPAETRETTAIQPPLQGKKAETVHTSGDWAVQVIAVRTQKAADEHKAKLKEAGFSAYTYQPPVNMRKKKKPWIRVFVGFFASQEEAQKAGDIIREKVFISKRPYWSVRFSPKEKEMLAGI